MRRSPILLSLLLAATVVSGCGSPHLEAALEQPTSTAAVVPSQTPQPTSTAEPTLAPQPTAEPATPTPASQAAQGAGVAAVQAVLDYWSAINDQDYARAYACWDGDGSASGQTFEQFEQGFADTLRVTAQVGVVDLAAQDAQAVTVPVTLAAIANAPGTPLGQIVQRYSGTYTLAPRAAGWRIVSANLVEADSGAQPPAVLADPAAVVQAYFDAINKRELARAYTYWDWGDLPGKQTFAQFVAGFATTAGVAFQLGEVWTDAGAGNLYAVVPAVIVATQADGSVQAYSGRYELHRANLQPWDQLGWRIQGADMAPAENVQLGSAEAERLLEVAGAHHMPLAAPTP